MLNTSLHDARAFGSLRVALFAALLVLLLGGCLQRPPPPPPPAPAPPPPPAGPTVAEQVKKLLDVAEIHLERKRLTTPPGNNALEVYEQIGRIDPGSVEVMRGKERIVELYLGNAEQNLARGDVEWAREYLQRARSVDRDHPGITPIAHRVELFAAARKKRFRLDAELLRERHESVGFELEKIGVEAKASNALVRIFARSDAEGRWMYEQLNMASGSNRLRAQIEIRSPAQVELLIFNETADSQRQPACTQPC